MPVAWLVTPLVERRDQFGRPILASALDEYSRQLHAERGDWMPAGRLPGRRQLVKVRASEGMLAKLAKIPGVVTLPVVQLDAPLATNQRDDLRALALELGYTTDEWEARIDSRAAARDALRLLASGRDEMRYDRESGQVVTGGRQEVLLAAIEAADKLIREDDARSDDGRPIART